MLIEQRLDYSKYVESGFGTGDCVLIADGTLNIVDYKHGKGVEVSADHNPQMMLQPLAITSTRHPRKSASARNRTRNGTMYFSGAAAMSIICRPA